LFLLLLLPLLFFPPFFLVFFFVPFPCPTNEAWGGFFICPFFFVPVSFSFSLEWERPDLFLATQTLEEPLSLFVFSLFFFSRKVSIHPIAEVKLPSHPLSRLPPLFFAFRFKRNRQPLRAAPSFSLFTPFFPLFFFLSNRFEEKNYASRRFSPLSFPFSSLFFGLFFPSFLTQVESRRNNQSLSYPSRFPS